MRSEAQTDLAEISRPSWNNNEPLRLLPSETRRVSMMMKSEERKAGISVCVCVWMYVLVSVSKHHLGSITDMKKENNSSRQLIFLPLPAFSLIISKNRNARYPNTHSLR